MQPLLQKKRPIAAFLPYRRQGGRLEYFLQMRDEYAPTHPNMYGMFGGGIEAGEEPHEALLREVQEELEYQPIRHRYFGYFEAGFGFFHAYIEEVGDDFESRVQVHEGKGGQFMTFAAATASGIAAPIALMITEAMERYTRELAVS